MAVDPVLADLFDAFVRDVPDFPAPGVVFKDITPLLGDPEGFAAVVDALSGVLEPDGRVDKVVGIEARGFILAAPVAYRLGAGFVPVRKAGKLPSATHEESYALEYGNATVEVHIDAFNPGDRVLVVDDVLATGGTAAATVELVRRAGAEVVGVAFLIELGFLSGRSRLPGLDVQALLTA
jgi:adenine phosphoribosyltransferase